MYIVLKIYVLMSSRERFISRDQTIIFYEYSINAFILFFQIVSDGIQVYNTAFLKNILY